MRVRAAIGLVALFAFVLPSAGPASVACAAEAPHAAVVVSTGHDVLRFCVTLDSPSVSGLRLIELAHDQYGLSFRLDGGAVCMLAGTGPAGGDCFGAYPDYWGYWRGTDSGGWAWSGSGAASTTVRGGDVEGWSWGSGDSAATHPPPPPTPFSSVCRTASPAASPAPSPTRPSPTRAHVSPSPPASPGVAAPASSPSPRNSPTPRPSRSRPGSKKHPAGKGKRPADKSMAETRSAALGSRTPSSRIASAAHIDGSGQRGLPAAGLTAMLIAAALLAGGWFVLRRRHLNA